ncbi:MAG: hypothetical protein H6838_05890 [Planctomycetes bacterium]|nr:hypothetical protein [Planctomycetota bacterium]
MTTTRTPAAANDSFPRWVALASLVVVLWLFFSNTVPAVRERTELQGVLSDLGDLHRQADKVITERRLGLASDRDLDLQALLVAIDQQGLTPAELCAAHPAPIADDENPGGAKGSNGPRKFR